jgi:hypothetical protein
MSMACVSKRDESAKRVVESAKRVVESARERVLCGGRHEVLGRRSSSLGVCISKRDEIILLIVLFSPS